MRDHSTHGKPSFEPFPEDYGDRDRHARYRHKKRQKRNQAAIDAGEPLPESRSYTVSTAVKHTEILTRLVNRGDRTIKEIASELDVPLKFCQRWLKENEQGMTKGGFPSLASCQKKAKQQNCQKVKGTQMLNREPLSSA